MKFSSQSIVTQMNGLSIGSQTLNTNIKIYIVFEIIIFSIHIFVRSMCFFNLVLINATLPQFYINKTFLVTI